MSSTEITIEPLSPALGAIIHGLDLREQLGDSEFRTLERVLHEREVVFLRDQPLEDEQHLALARRFGTPKLYPVLEILGQLPPERIEDGPESPPKTDYWHSDVTWQAVPPKITILSAKVVPQSGGDTMWASMSAAFEALSEPMQRILAGLEAHHDVSPEYFERVEAGLGRENADLVRRKLEAGADHPLVTRHPRTGRKVLFFGGEFIRSINGLHPDESRAILDFLWRHIDRPDFTLRWRWRANDVALWDNRSTLHRAIGDHHPARRVVHRCTVEAEAPPRA